MFGSNLLRKWRHEGVALAKLSQRELAVLPACRSSSLGRAVRDSTDMRRRVARAKSIKFYPLP
jgi:hypothetical protein